MGKPAELEVKSCLLQIIEQAALRNPAHSCEFGADSDLRLGERGGCPGGVSASDRVLGGAQVNFL